MPPWDRVLLPTPPNYAANNNFMLGLGQMIGQIPDQYYQGQQQARTTALQQAFPNGLPMDANGQIDINAVVDRMAKLGGAPAIEGILPTLLQNQQGADV